MLSIPLYIFLFIYFFVILFCLAFFALIIYFLSRSAALTFYSFICTFALFGVLILTIFGTWYVLRDINWSEENLVLKLPFLSGNVNTFNE